MYNHLLVKQVQQQGEPLTAEENLLLYGHARAGDASAREHMITGNMPLVIEWVNNFIQDGRLWLEYLRDDLTCDGFLGLVGAVNNLVKREETVENVIGYLRAAVLAKLFTAIEWNQNIRRPQSGGRARRDDNWILPSTVSVDMEKLTTGSEIRAVDLRDFVQGCCHNNIEQQCVSLREMGYSDEEIAKILRQHGLSTDCRRRHRPGIHAATVGRIIHRIETEVQQEWYD